MNQLPESSSEEEMAQSLSRIVRMRRHNIAMAPALLLRNVVRSFGHMLLLRLQRTLFSMMERSAQQQLSKRGSEGEIKMTAKQKKISTMLTEESSSGISPLSPIAAVTNFCVLNTPRRESLMTRMHEQNMTSQKHGRVQAVLGLEFEVEVDVLILGKDVVTVYFAAPGTISGVFTNKKNRPDSVDIWVDTVALLNSMRQQCRDVVRTAMTVITGSKSKDGCPEREPHDKLSVQSDVPSLQESIQPGTEARDKLSEMETSEGRNDLDASSMRFSSNEQHEL